MEQLWIFILRINVCLVYLLAYSEERGQWHSAAQYAGTSKRLEKCRFAWKGPHTNLIGARCKQDGFFILVSTFTESFFDFFYALFFLCLLFATTALFKPSRDAMFIENLWAALQLHSGFPLGQPPLLANT